MLSNSLQSENWSLDVTIALALFRGGKKKYGLTVKQKTLFLLFSVLHIWIDLYNEIYLDLKRDRMKRKAGSVSKRQISLIYGSHRVIPLLKINGKEIGR